ncbi:MAG: D-2-hydroxyacid dehydrogenase [Oscillospiraceae bacterium]|nr:D-2-hydroxyacid dehydrogenase [Oscillospiraceae bacterium]
MNIVILDGYTENPGDLSWDALKAIGDVVVYDRTPLTDQAEIVRRIGGAQIVLTNKTPLNREVLEACPALEYIGVLATGYNIVDTAAAKAQGIIVTNVPAYGTEAVAQFAIALLLEVCHHIGHHDRAVHSGRWTECPDFCFWDMPLIELSGKTIGIVGFGRIGRTTARIASALGMKVLATDEYPDDSGAAIADYVQLETLLERSDVISLHCPLTPATEGLIRKETIAKMKDGVILINNARGQLIREIDLCEALESGKVAAAGLDVVSTEPIRADNPLLRAKNCIITPHISWASKESRARLMEIAVENVRGFISGAARNVVNP